MKSIMILLLALVAMAASQGVNIVDNNPSPVNVVDNNPSHVHVVDNNPSHVHVVDNNPSHVHVVDNNPSHVNVVDNNHSQVHVVEQPENQGGGFIVDPGFSRPTINNPNNGYEPISTGPAIVDQGQYPYRDHGNPFLRGGH